MKRFLLAAAAAGVLAFTASAASAATFLVDNISMNTNYVVGLTNQNSQTFDVYDNAQSLHTTIGDIITALCVDMTHFDSLGTHNPPKHFHTAALTTDFDGHALSLDQIGHLGWFFLGQQNSSDPFHSAAYQAATWIVEGGSVNFKGNTALENLTNSLVADSHRVNPNNVIAFVNDSGGQSFGGYVPEPSAWALMILGFGGMGFALRRRRAQVAFA